MKKYAAYKPSGVEWLSEVPAHWEVKRLKFVVELGNSKTDETTDPMPYVGLENIESWTGRRIESTITTEESQGVIFQPGDVLFCKLRPYLAKVHLASSPGACTSEALVMKPNHHVHAEYLQYCLLNPDFINAVDASTYGAKMPRASWDFIGNQLQLLPPLSEQRAIVAFLDERTAHLDGLIRRKEGLLKLLAEQRAALITRAVTRGFDAAPLQESGVPWLGQVPAHWEVKRLKYMLDGIEQGWSPQCDNQPAEAGEWGVLKVGCVNGDAFDPMENKRLPADLDPLLKYEVQPGDVLMSRANTKELVGSTAIVRELPTRLMLCDKLYRLQVPASKVDEEFLVYMLRSKVARVQYELGASGASGSMQNIGQDTVQNLELVFPPLAEQVSIAAAIRQGNKRLDKMTDITTREIEKLREYRAVLITAAVTGRIDVRVTVAVPELVEA